MSLGTALTIGNFDGVHLGHQRIIQQVVQKAKHLHLIPTVVTFEPLPQTFLRPQSAPFRLMNLRQKSEILKKWGIQKIYCIRFNEKIAKLSPLAFVETYLIKKLNTRFLLVGKDFRFGHRQEGTIACLQRYALQYGFELEIMDLVNQNDLKISSSQIRQALKMGNLETVKNLLGRNFSLEQRVMRGAMRGRMLGFPTANLSLRSKELGLKGVFVTQVKIEDKLFFAVTNVGTRPTVDGKNYLAETHVLDFSGDLYGKRIKVEFLHKIRDEMRFESVEDLKKQIEKDVVRARDYLRDFR